LFYTDIVFFRSKQLIKDAIMDNDFLKNLDSSQVRELVDSMYPLEYAKGSYVIREGEAGMMLDISRDFLFFSLPLSSPEPSSEFISLNYQANLILAIISLPLTLHYMKLNSNFIKHLKSLSYRKWYMV
jgi:hypothetical protein